MIRSMLCSRRTYIKYAKQCHSNIKRTIVKCIIENMIASWSYPKRFRRF